MRTTRWILFSTCILFLWAFVSACTSSSESKQTLVDSKQKAPSFILQDLANEQELQVPEDFEGKKVALLFFSTG